MGIDKIILSLSIIILSLAGCSVNGSKALKGYLYSHTKIPYTKDLNNTPVTKTHVDGKIIHIREPFYGASAEMYSNAIGNIAKKYNLSKIYFADIETVSILRDLYKSQTVHVYGAE